MPNLALQIPDAPAFAAAAESWRTARVDVSENTMLQRRSSIRRALPVLGPKRIDAIGMQAIADLVADLHDKGKARESIRKTVSAVGMVLDHHAVEPNPARDRRVKLPREEQEELQPPTAEDVETVGALLASSYRLPLLWLDWSGARLASVEKTLVGDYDEARRRVRLRKATQKNRAALWVELPAVLAEAIEATLPPRDDRDLSAPLFPDVSGARLRTAVGRACRAAGVAEFSPHDLRHRRISLLHRQGRSWADIGAFVGQRSLKVTADTYTHVLLDDREVNYAQVLNRAHSGTGGAVPVLSGTAK